MTDAGREGDLPALFERAGNRFHPQAGAVGPWDPDALHGGAVSGLLGYLIEETPPVGPRVARVTVDLLGPVPRQELVAEVETVRPGRKVDVLEGRLLHDGRLVARASAVRVVPRAPDERRGVMPPVARPAAAEGRTPHRRVAASSPFFRGIDFLVVDGAIGDPGPVAVWCRVRHRWIDGIEPTGLVRALAALDSAYGYGSPLSSVEWLFVNVDLSLHLHRHPHGDWLLVDTATAVSDDGIGTASARLADADGTVGHAAQSVVVTPRRTAG